MSFAVYFKELIKSSKLSGDVRKIGEATAAMLTEFQI